MTNPNIWKEHVLDAQDYHVGFGANIVAHQINNPEYSNDALVTDLVLARKALTDVVSQFNATPIDRWYEEAIKVPWLRHSIVAHSKPGASFIGAMLELDPGGYTLPDATLLNILQISNHYLVQKNESLQPTIIHHQNEFKKRFAAFSEQGGLPVLTDALARIGDSVQSIHVDDGIQTSSMGYEGVCRELYGEHEGKFDIVVSNDTANNPQALEHALYHELSHVAIDNDSVKNKLMPMFMKLLPEVDEFIMFSLLDEFAAEHLAQVLLGKRGINDVHVEETERAYPSERRVVEEICMRSGGAVNGELLLSVIFGDKESMAVFEKTISNQIIAGVFPDVVRELGLDPHYREKTEASMRDAFGSLPVTV